MSLPESAIFNQISYFITQSYECSYLPGKQARSKVAAPIHWVNATRYDDLIKHGFRRSGQYTYKPHCESCQACVPLRVPVQEFKPNRSQKRSFNQYQQLQIYIKPLSFDAEHLALYLHYQTYRHQANEPIEQLTQQYENFLLVSNVNTQLIEFRLESKLVMVSVVDLLSDGVSSVYTFYNPSITKGLGTYNVLWQIEYAKLLQKKYVYLGYWINDSQKMAYKTSFKPYEIYQNDYWKLCS
jgi:leucyl-tRNA---protein transferase